MQKGEHFHILLFLLGLYR